MDNWKIYLAFIILISISIGVCNTESTPADASEEEELISANYVLPKQIFNDGKPFYVDKDPVSGKLDFSSKKPAGIEPEENEVIDPKEKATVLSSVSPNFHDFLNLPVKYSSSKFVYPLVSSSYANLKYQGNNKNYVSNHKNYTTTTSTTSTPKYYTLHKQIISSVKPTPTRNVASSSTFRPAQQVVTDRTTTKHKFVPTKKLTTTERPVTKPSTTQKLQKSTTPSTTTTESKRTTTTRPSTTTQRTTTTTERIIPSSSSKSPSTTTKLIPKTTIAPTTVENIALTTTTPKITTPKINKTTRISTTIKTTIKPTEKLTSPPIVNLSSTNLSTLDAGDVYKVVGDKNEPNTMSLADLFHALVDDETSYKPSNEGFDKQGNLMQPFSPAKPAPFTLHQLDKVSKQPKLPTTPIPISTSTERVMQDTSKEDANNYVRYEVQQPNVMQVQYHPAPSMNNIVISPGQNSASFVLGSQQSIGNNHYIGTVEKEPLFQNGERIQYGTVINEDLAAAMRPQVQQPVLNISSSDDYYQTVKISPENQEDNEHDMHELTVSTTNVRFPNDIIGSGSVNFGGVPDVVNGHAQPMALPHVQINPVAFPQNDNQWTVEGNLEENAPASNVVFKDEALHEVKVPDKHEILSLNQHNHHNQVSFPQLPEDLTPPHLPEEHLRPHITSSPPHLYNEFTRKPLLGLHRPNPERPLPNILPQFRPNAKLSSGHPAHTKEPGNIRITHQKLPYPNRSLPPPFAHRRTPIGNRYGPKLNIDPSEANRRVFRVPHPPHPIHPVDRVYMQRQPQMHRGPPPPPPMRYVENYNMERHPINSGDIYNIPKVEVQPERLPAFEEEDLMVEDPPKPVMEKEPELPKLEPVVTLQMLKSQKKPQAEATNENVEAPAPAGNNGQSPVYVVYPVKSSPLQMDMFDPTDLEDPIVIGQRGEQPPQPPAADRDVSSDYQNTPFSVIRDHPQEPILMVKNKSQLPNKSSFPYPLEKPDSALSEFNDQSDRYNRETTPELTPRVVNRGSNVNDDVYRNTDIPIAIAYTPTEPSKYNTGYSYEKFSHPNLASPVIPEIRDTQTEAAITEELDTRGQYFEKDFMAPFYPSMSLNSVTNSPNGWSIYPGTTDASVFEKNNIDRADVISPVKDSEDSTKKFDPQSFQPELQGGFKPIYPPGYKTKETSEDESEKSLTNSEIAISITSTTTTTEKPPERKKSKLEASIESLFFGDDSDFEDDDETEKPRSSTSR